MEPDRRFPIVDFDAQKFTAFFGEETASLRAQLLSGGACNSNYLVRSSGGKFVCRIHSRGDPLLERQVLKIANDLIPSPECLWVDDGVSVLSYIDGQHFEPTTQLVREAGRIIGRLSTVTYPRPGQLEPDGGVTEMVEWSSFKIGLSAFLTQPAVEEYLDKPTVLELRKLIDRNTPILDSFDRCQNLVHGDFRPDNILVANDSIVGVLDWEFAHSGCSYMDIGNVLRHLSPKWENDLSLGLRDEGFELPDNWVFRASLIDLTSHLEFLTSNRSQEFKLTCVHRIHRLIKIAARSK